MATLRIRLVVTLLLSFVLVSSADGQELWSLEWLQSRTTQQLQSLATHLQDGAITHADYTEPGYWKWLAETHDRVRNLLFERGARVAPLRIPEGAASRAGMTIGAPMVPGSAPASNTTGAIAPGAPNSGNTQGVGTAGTRSGNTQAVPTAGATGGQASGGPRLVTPAVVPLTIVLTALQIAECESRGIDVGKCAAQVAMTTAGTLAAGAVIAVVLPSGVPVLTAMGLGAAGMITILNSVYAGYEGVGMLNAWLREFRIGREQAGQQRFNADRLTPADIARLTAAFQQQIDASLAEGRGLNDAAARFNLAKVTLANLLTRAERAHSEFETQNRITKNASGHCRNPERNPVLQAIDAEKSAKEATTKAQTIVDAVNDARRLAAACESAAAARQAKAAWDRARAGIPDLESVHTSTLNRKRDAELFFTALARARQSAVQAGRQVAELRAIAEEAVTAKADVDAALDAYTSDRDRVRQSWQRNLSAFEALSGAFPNPAPPHIQQILAQIDPRRHVDPTTGAPDDDALRHERGRVDADLGRITGLHRFADQQFDALLDCRDVPDRMPAELTRLFERLTSESTQAKHRADQAIAAAGTLDATIASCLSRWTTNTGSVGQTQNTCSAIVEATPEEGRPGTPLRVRVRMQSGGRLVQRVEIDNPGCRDARCRRMDLVGADNWQIWLAFQAPPNATATGGVISRFKVRFNAFATGDRLACSGESPELRVLAR